MACKLITTRLNYKRNKTGAFLMKHRECVNCERSAEHTRGKSESDTGGSLLPPGWTDHSCDCYFARLQHVKLS